MRRVKQLPPLLRHVSLANNMAPTNFWGKGNEVVVRNHLEGVWIRLSLIPTGALERDGQAGMPDLPGGRVDSLSRATG
jgi:hypothetical protein